jgi:hypothetical protein
MWVVNQHFAHAQTGSCARNKMIHRDGISEAPQCVEATVPSLQVDTLLTRGRNGEESDNVNLQKRSTAAASTVQPVILIGFVGGFVRRDDVRHPEVQFAEYLRDRYGSEIHAEVFGNHHGRLALHEVLRLLDTDGDGTLTSAEKGRAKIVIFGHSWGGTETAVFARDSGKMGIPVMLTIQIDAIRKPGRNSSMIPPNVASAVNFYQTRGPLHGLSKIYAADSARTTIIGNVLMTYQDHPINCDNYPWNARMFNKPHHEIENDPRVWDRAVSPIDPEIPDTIPGPAATWATTAQINR